MHHLNLCFLFSQRCFKQTLLLFHLSQILSALTVVLNCLFHLFLSVLHLVGEIIALVLPFSQHVIQVLFQLQLFFRQLVREFI